jgi:hypothetical protein
MRTGESETESHQLVPVGVLGSTFLVHAWTLRENTHPHCRDLARKINILWGGRCLRVRGTGNGLSGHPPSSVDLRTRTSRYIVRSVSSVKVEIVETRKITY